MVDDFCLFEVDATLSDGCGFDNACTVSAKWNIHRVILRLYGWVYGYDFPLVVEHSVVMSDRLNSMGSQFSISVLWNLCSESVVA